MAKVVLTEDAKDDLRDLDGSAQELVVKGLVKLQTEPEKRGEPLGARASSDLTGFRKLVVGNRTYRIVYRVEADGTVCVVWVIGRRVDGEAYKVALERARKHPDAKLAKAMERVLDSAFSLESVTPLPIV